MTREGYQRLMAVFEAACSRSGEERTSFLDEVCGGDPSLRSEVEKLLAADEQSQGLLERPIVNLASTIGSQIGSYKIEAKLGEGGMGIVFRARDTRLNRQVGSNFSRAIWPTPPLADVSNGKRRQHLL